MHLNPNATDDERNSTLYPKILLDYRFFKLAGWDEEQTRRQRVSWLTDILQCETISLQYQNEAMEEAQNGGGGPKPRGTIAKMGKMTPREAAEKLGVGWGQGTALLGHDDKQE